jgi:glycerophosphoryl diester phosphodiesterase
VKRWKIASLAVATAAVTLSLLNASWIAPKPNGALIRLADRGVAQPLERGPGCDAARMRASEHLYIENTLPSLSRALTYGARAVAIDVQPTSDGRMVVFRDSELECRTNGTGRVRDRDLAYLRSLDAGYEYTPDGGGTFPLRGRGIGAIPTVEEALYAVRGMTVVFRFVDGTRQDADLLRAAIERAGMKPDAKLGFIGDDAATARMVELAPGSWRFDESTSDACRSGYVATGWIGIVPDACSEQTVAVTVDDRWKLWGWPYRFLSRMRGAEARMMMVHRLDENGLPAGLDALEQIPLVPSNFKGLLWIDDMHHVGRAIR